MTKADAAWLAPLRARFTASLPERRTVALRLRREGDRAGLIDLAHMLAGGAGMMDKPRIGEAAFALEDALREGGEGTVEFEALIAAIDRALG